MSAIVITYASPLPSCANLREHWYKRAGRVKRQRQTAFLHCLGKTTVQDDGSLIVTLARISPRALDDDNLQSAFKAVRDGVADAIGVKDNDPRVSWRYEQRKGKPKEQAIEIRIEAARKAKVAA